LVGFEGWEEVVERYVPRAVYNKLLQKFKGYFDRWNTLWKRIGAEGDNPKRIYDRLIGMYSEPHRHYHNFVHIAHSLRQFDEEGLRTLASDPDAIETATWFHDAVYDTHAEDNEEKSAELAYHTLKSLGLPHCFANKVSDLIRATKHADVPEDFDAKLMVDLDLSAIAKDMFPETRRYIRDEYSWVPEDEFGAKRAAFFEVFLNRGVFTSNVFKQKYEARAMDNVEKEIAELKQ
jgi:predicted metal-dependent HD superfamily phosphohydrolase